MDFSSKLGGQLLYSEILAALHSLNTPKDQFVLLLVLYSGCEAFSYFSYLFSVEVDLNL